MTFAVFADRDSNGGALDGGAPSWHTTEAGCQAACIGRGGVCNGYTYVFGNGACYLKDKNACSSSSMAKVSPGKNSGFRGDCSAQLTCAGKILAMPAGSCKLVTVGSPAAKVASPRRALRRHYDATRRFE